MNNVRWIAIVSALLLAAMVGVVAYDARVAQGDNGPGIPAADLSHLFQRFLGGWGCAG